MEGLERVMALLGVGKREVQIYITLVERGALTAREISDALGIPYTKVYQHLNRLEKVGAVNQERGSRPAKFKAVPPSEVYRRLVNTASDVLKTLKPTFDTLQMLYESRYREVAPTFLTLIRGQDRVVDLIQEVVTAAEAEAYLAIPFPEVATYRLLATLTEESRRISIKVLTTEALRQRFDLPPRVEVRTTQEMFGGGAIGGAVVIFVKYSGDISGIYSNERFIAEIARTYFNHLWQRAR